MSVVRVQKRRERFTVLSTETLRVEGLSLRARGLWAVCMSFPDDWEFRATHLRTLSEHDGRRAVQSALKELEGAGLAALETVRGDDGRVRGRRWTIYEEPGLNPAVTGGPEGGPAPAPGGDPSDRGTDNPVLGLSGGPRRTGPPSVGETEDRSDRPTAKRPLQKNKQHGAPRERTKEQQQARPREAPRVEVGGDGAAAALLEEGGEGGREATDLLVRRGVDRSVAEGLVRTRGAEAVRRAVALYDERRRGPRPPAGPGWLVAAVRRGYAAETTQEAPLMTHAEMVAWCEANGMGRMREFEAVRQPGGGALFRGGLPSPPLTHRAPRNPRPDDP